ncbi:hypothetical protein [Streptomyces axinellae]|uniref:NUDIX hydrolase n=1 Tax=Streptomyces axinellae TaxID=552788 RepID=A0ABP6CKR4_9ACTN
MSYRIGAYVIDRRTSELGLVMNYEGPHLRLRPPRGGIDWDCPPSAARLATEAERHEAGIAANGTERTLTRGDHA